MFFTEKLQDSNIQTGPVRNRCRKVAGGGGVGRKNEGERGKYSVLIVK